jgi:acetyl esterase/lipase
VYDIEYRLAPGATFPAQLDDVICALGHVRAHAAEDGVDPERVALLGRSAGAHLALLAAYRAGRDPLPDGCGRPATVRGVISLYGPTDLARDHRVPAVPDLIGGSKTIEDLLGGVPDAIPAAYALATPQRSLDHPVPPTLLIHGGADQIVQPFNSRSLAAALSQNGNAVALVELPWAGHGFDAVSWGLGGQIALSAMQRFLGLALR